MHSNNLYYCKAVVLESTLLCSLHGLHLNSNQTKGKLMRHCCRTVLNQLDVSDCKKGLTVCLMLFCNFARK